MKINTTVWYHHLAIGALERVQWKQPAVPTVTEDMMQLELSCTANGSIKFYNHL